MTTTLVTYLRKAGLLVKTVGLRPGHIKGAHGLTLVPDLMLGKALPFATRTICVVIPYPIANLNYLKNDPRLVKFLTKAKANRAKFVFGPVSESDTSILQPFTIPPEQIIPYPESGETIPFARMLVETLVTINES